MKKIPLLAYHTQTKSFESYRKLKKKMLLGSFF